MLVTCVYVVSSATPWVEQSLFLAAIGEARDKGAKALEAFAYRYPEGESTYERFLVHRTVFPRDFLADFGFRSVRAEGRVELARLELGGLVPVAEGKRASVLRVVKEAFAPAPVPAAALAAAAGAGVGERRAGDRQEPPVVRARAERQPQDAVRPVVDDLARGQAPEHRVVAAPAGADDE